LQQIEVQGLACKRHRNESIQLHFNQGLDCKITRIPRTTFKAAFGIGKRSRFGKRLLVVFFLGHGSGIKGRDVSPLNAAPHGHYCRPLPAPIDLWLYKKPGKGNLARGGKTEREEAEQKRKGRRNRTRAKFWSIQPAAPRAFTTTVFILNGEDWTEQQKRENRGGRKRTERTEQARARERRTWTEEASKRKELRQRNTKKKTAKSKGKRESET